MRRITLFVLAILMALFAGITVQSAYAQQATSGQITGSEETITYNGNTYSKLDPIPKNDPTFETSACGAPVITSAYIHIDSTSKTTEVVCSKDFSSGEAIYVSFPNAKITGDNQVSTYGTITSQERDDIVAIQRRYDLKGLPSGPDQVTDDKVKNADIPLPAVAGNEASYKALYEKFTANIKGESPVSLGSSTNSNSNSTTTCDSKFTHGIGWIICPVTSFLADTMDRLYNVLISFLTVTPLSTNKSGPLYYAWGLMRNIANILFIIGFLIIIYSQITNTGMSSHGMKRLLPRLVIAAILVNISYWVVAIAVDLSNILGVALKDIFDQIGDNIQKNANPVWQGTKWSDLSWQNLAGFALSGGAATFAIASFAGGVIASAGGSIWLILVTLAGLMVSALVAILVLAARQALIVLFIVISPLAFVAYLLPSTEKYFHRWRELFTTMLLIFPIFSVVFGASHLAGMLIIYNANPGTPELPNPNFLNILVLGMAVQVAPLIITPLLVKVSGSLLGRIAGIVNDPNKGIVDGTRKFAEGRRDRTRYRRMSDRDDNGNLKHNNPLAWGARRMAIRDAAMKQKLHSWEGAIEAEAANDHRVHEAHHQHELNEMRKNTGESGSKAEFNRHLAHSEMLRRMYYSEQKAREDAEAASKNIATQWEGLKANPDVIGTSEAERRIGEEARNISDETKGLAYREAAAKQIIDKNYHGQLAENEKMQEFAGFSAVDPYGASRVKNLADENEFKAREARITASNAAMGRADATIEEMKAVVLGDEANAGRFKAFVKDADSRSAALRRLQQKAPMFAYQEIQETLDLSSNASSDIVKATLRSEMASALGERKIFYISNTHRTEMLEGKLDPKYLHEAGRDLMIKETLDLSGLGADAMVSVDRDELKAVRDYLRKHKLSSLNANAQQSLINSIELAFNDDRYSGRMGKSRTELNEIREELGLGRID